MSSHAIASLHSLLGDASKGDIGGSRGGGEKAWALRGIPESAKEGPVHEAVFSPRSCALSCRKFASWTVLLCASVLNGV